MSTQDTLKLRDVSKAHTDEETMLSLLKSSFPITCTTQEERDTALQILFRGTANGKISMFLDIFTPENLQNEKTNRSIRDFLFDHIEKNKLDIIINKENLEPTLSLIKKNSQDLGLDIYETWNQLKVYETNAKIIRSDVDPSEEDATRGSFVISDAGFVFLEVGIPNRESSSSTLYPMTGNSAMFNKVNNLLEEITSSSKAGKRVYLSERNIPG